jgi:ABC-type transport system involved in multi-copper enzyme maturation permease subunit
MTAGTITPYRSGAQTGRDGFAQLLHAEWTKFRTVRGWVIGMVVAALLPVLFAFGGSGMHGSCNVSACTVPVGPGGEEVTDQFYFAHRPLAGNGSITVRVTSLTGMIPATPSSGANGGSGRRPAGQGSPGMRSGLLPWSKAGIIIKASTRQGSAYAAMMVTGGHGVRMQYDYTRDTAGLTGGVSAASPRWLRLTRSGDTLTGYDSADGTHWTRVGAATLAGLPSTVQAGLFATSPQFTQVVSQFILTGTAGGPSLATAAFDRVGLHGTWPGDAWTGDDVGGPANASAPLSGGFRQSGGRFTVSGSGDIAPDVPPGGFGLTIAQALVGTFAGLIVVIVVGAMFMTAEYRRGLIRVTLAASPRRGRVLAAKAIVIGSVAFVAGLAGTAVAVPLGVRLLRDGGQYVFPVTPLTAFRVIVGTAALLAVAAVLALALAAMLRRSAGAVTAVIVVIVLPYLLVISALPAGPADWLTRVTPAAAFAVQQTVPQYPQVTNPYTPAAGYFPLAPWAGLAVLCAWAAAALGLAVILLRRRDA